MTLAVSQEPIDGQCGRLPFITETATTITFEFGILGGALRDGLFVPTSRTRLLIHCDRDGDITVRILDGRASAERREKEI